MLRRRFLPAMTALGVAAMVPSLPGCAGRDSIRLAIHPWIGYETLRLAKLFHWLPAQVELQECMDLNNSSAAVQSGVADAACLTLDEVLRIRGLGVALTVVLVFDVSDGADVVLAKSEVRGPSELKAKRIGIEHGTLSSLMLSKFLEFARLAKSDVQLVDIAQDRMAEAWQRNEIDAAITYEPTATVLKRAGGHVVFDSRQAPDTIIDVLALRNDRLHHSSSLIQGLVKAHFQGLTHLRTHSEDAMYRIATSQNISPGEVRTALSGVVLPTLEANREYLAPQGRLQHSARTLSATMLREKLLTQDDNLNDLVTGRWLPSGPM